MRGAFNVAQALAYAAISIHFRVAGQSRKIISILSLRLIPASIPLNLSHCAVSYQ